MHPTSTPPYTPRLQAVTPLKRDPAEETNTTSVPQPHGTARPQLTSNNTVAQTAFWKYSELKTLARVLATLWILAPDKANKNVLEELVNIVIFFKHRTLCFSIRVMPGFPPFTAHCHLGFSASFCPVLRRVEHVIRAKFLGATSTDMASQFMGTYSLIKYEIETLEVFKGGAEIQSLRFIYTSTEYYCDYNVFRQNYNKDYLITELRKVGKCSRAVTAMVTKRTPELSVVCPGGTLWSADHSEVVYNTDIRVKKGDADRGADEEQEKEEDVERGADKEQEREGDAERGADEEQEREGDVERGADEEQERKGGGESERGEGAEQEEGRRNPSQQRSIDGDTETPTETDERRERSRHVPGGA
ncbi:hypothetical protein NDU88_000973 [Pleurodeles waltl]|uniref:Uncharacterized protein n=1 Tax=Pleurodeles waltl TaxID=8319 RepID=A0AAV7M1R9_PLEWA|nr:hypothetical protein NDU88_000973 [Pleurodeles waltl]